MILRLLTILIVLVGCVQEENEAFFCPQDQCENRIISAIGNAEESIDLAIYSFTSEEIAKAISNAKTRGVEIKIVTDKLQSHSNYSQLNELEKNGIKVRILNKTMHNKFIIIDKKITITGSFNYTTNADERNKENILISFDSKIADRYSEEFFLLWTEAG